MEGLIEELGREAEGLRLENEVLAGFLARKQGPEESGGNRREKKQQRRNLPQQLSVSQKNVIANTELEMLQAKSLDNEKRAEKLADTLRAVSEETDARIAELKKEAYEFKRDIVIGAENMRTGKTEAEKLTRYMEEKLRQRDALIEKLRLKNAALKAQIHKVETQLKHKEDMGDVLHYIDFHQLQIENRQYQTQIEQRNDELLRLKTSTGTTLQLLNNLKHTSAQCTKEFERIASDIDSRKRQLTKVQAQTSQILRDNSKKSTADLNPSDNDNNEGKDPSQGHKASSQTQNALNHCLPSTAEYLNQKVQLNQLDADLLNWSRKLDILQLSVRQKN